MRALTVALLALALCGCWKSSHLHHAHKHKPPKTAAAFPQILVTSVDPPHVAFTVGALEGQGDVGQPIQVRGPHGEWDNLQYNGKRVLVSEIQPDKVLLQVEGEAQTRPVPLPGQTPAPAPQPQPGGAPPK